MGIQKLSVLSVRDFIFLNSKLSGHTASTGDWVCRVAGVADGLVIDGHAKCTRGERRRYKCEDTDNCAGIDQTCPATAAPSPFLGSATVNAIDGGWWTPLAAVVQIPALALTATWLAITTAVDRIACLIC